MIGAGGFGKVMIRRYFFGSWWPGEKLNQKRGKNSKNANTPPEEVGRPTDMGSPCRVRVTPDLFRWRRARGTAFERAAIKRHLIADSLARGIGVFVDCDQSEAFKKPVRSVYNQA